MKKPSCVFYLDTFNSLVSKVDILSHQLTFFNQVFKHMKNVSSVASPLSDVTIWAISIFGNLK